MPSRCDSEKGSTASLDSSSDRDRSLNQQVGLRFCWSILFPRQPAEPGLSQILPDYNCMLLRLEPNLIAPLTFRSHPSAGQTPHVRQPGRERPRCHRLAVAQSGEFLAPKDGEAPARKQVGRALFAICRRLSLHSSTCFSLTRNTRVNIVQTAVVDVGVAPEEAALLTAWSTSTWFPECASSPPTLLISGTDMCHAITLLRMLRCLCRRALLLADISRSGLLDVTFLQPTLLLNQPGRLPKIWPLFGASNHQGVSVLGKGRAHHLAGCKAFFLGMEHTWTDGAVHFALPPARGDLPTLDAQRQAEIARRIQSNYLMYRLRNLQKIRESHSAADPVNFPHTATAHNLAACIEGEPNIAQAIAPILQRQEQDAHVQNGCDIARAIIEVIWAPLHDREEIPISRIADLANALLRSRGETLEYSAEEVGWKLKNLGFCRHRTGSGMILRASRENRIVSHQLAQRLCLNLPPVHGCADCIQSKVVVAE